MKESPLDSRTRGHTKLEGQTPKRGWARSIDYPVGIWEGKQEDGVNTGRTVGGKGKKKNGNLLQEAKSASGEHVPRWNGSCQLVRRESAGLCERTAREGRDVQGTHRLTVLIVQEGNVPLSRLDEISLEGRGRARVSRTARKEPRRRNLQKAEICHR